MAVWLVWPPTSVTKPATRPLLEQHRRVGRGEVVGHDHRALRDLHLHVHHLAHQVPDDAVGDEVHVGPALAEVLVGDVRRSRCLIFRVTASHRPLGVDAGPSAMSLLHLVDEHRVVQHQAVGLEDQRVVLAVALLQPVLELGSWWSERSIAVLNRISSALHLLVAEPQLRCADPLRSSTKARPTAMPGLAPMPWSFRRDRLGAHRVTFTAPPRSGWR